MPQGLVSKRCSSYVVSDVRSVCFLAATTYRILQGKGQPITAS